MVQFEIGLKIKQSKKPKVKGVQCDSTAKKIYFEDKDYRNTENIDDKTEIISEKQVSVDIVGCKCRHLYV